MFFKILVVLISLTPLMANSQELYLSGVATQVECTKFTYQTDKKLAGGVIGGTAGYLLGGKRNRVLGAVIGSAAGIAVALREVAEHVCTFNAYIEGRSLVFQKTTNQPIKEGELIHLVERNGFIFLR